MQCYSDWKTRHILPKGQAEERWSKEQVMLKFRVCLRNRALIFFKIHQRNYIQSWFGAKQLLNKKKPPLIQEYVRARQYLGVKNTSSHLTGGSTVVFCSKRTYSELIQNTTCGNMKICQQHNFMQKSDFSKDHKSTPLSRSGSKIPLSGSETPVHSEHWGPYVVSQIQQLEESSRFHGYSTLRWGLSGFVVLFGFVYFFRDRLRDNVADEVADVASRSMGKIIIIICNHGLWCQRWFAILSNRLSNNSKA